MQLKIGKQRERDSDREREPLNELVCRHTSSLSSCLREEALGATSERVVQGSVDSESKLLLLQRLSCQEARPTTMHLWLLLSAALAFVPQRSVPAIRGLQAVVEDIDALSFRELQAACKERGLPARGATDVLRERLREHLADAPSDAGTDADAIDLDAALAADDAAFAEEELIAPDAEAADDDRAYGTNQ